MKFEVRPMREDEFKYTFPMSTQLFMQTCYIGTLTAALDNQGQLTTSWTDVFANLKTAEFLREIYFLIKDLQKKGEMLCSLKYLSEMCKSNRVSDIGSGQFGIRFDSHEYCYLVRLNPEKKSENFNCYCYKSKWLDTHLYKSSRGIRFLNSYGKELFRLPDGGRIRINNGDGSEVEHVCRYLDDDHFEVNDNFYNIYKFAKCMQDNGFTYEALDKI